MRQTRLTEEYGLKDLLATEPGAIPLFAWDANKVLAVASDAAEFKPTQGWTVLTLVPAVGD